MAKLEAQQPTSPGAEVFVTAASCNGIPHHFRFENLELTHTASPDVFPPDAVDPKPINTLVMTHARYCPGQPAQYMIFDRVYAHGTGAPARLRYAFSLEGEHMGLINSYIDRVDYWRPFETPAGPVTLSADKTAITVPRQSYRRNQGDEPWTIPDQARATLTADSSFTGAYTGYLGPEGLTIEYSQGAALISCVNCAAVQNTSPSAPYNRFKWFSGTIVSGRLNLEFTADPWNTSAYAPEGSIGVYLNDGGGPYEISNNYMEAYGITFLIDGGGIQARSPSNMVFRRNWLFRNQNHRFTSPLSDGYRYLIRQQWEIKRGRRFWLDGNLFEGNWASVTQGSTILLSTATLPNRSLEEGVSDIAVTNNVIRNSSAGFYCWGLPMAPANPPITERILFANNLVYGIDQFEYDAESPNGRGDIVRTGGCQDVSVRNNTFGSNVGTGPSQLVVLGPPMEGLRVTDNIMYLNFGWPNWGGITADAINSTYLPIMQPGSFTRMLETGFARAGGTIEPNYEFRNNVIIGGVAGVSKAELRDLSSAEMAGYIGQYPPGNFFPSGASKAVREGQVLFEGLERNDYRLKQESSYRGKASRGGDIGVNAYQLAAALGLVQAVRQVEPGEQTAVFAYTAPDQRACWVDTRADGTNWTRIADSGGGREREVVVTGLQRDTDYEYRIFCYYEQVNSADHPGAYGEDQITKGTFRTLAGSGADWMRNARSSSALHRCAERKAR